MTHYISQQRSLVTHYMNNILLDMIPTFLAKLYQDSLLKFKIHSHPTLSNKKMKQHLMIRLLINFTSATLCGTIPNLVKYQ